MHRHIPILMLYCNAYSTDLLHIVSLRSTWDGGSITNNDNSKQNQYQTKQEVCNKQ